MRICPVRALRRKTETGAIVLDCDRCIGCKQCMVVCPFGAIHFNHATGRLFKCDLCDGDPECVKWCYTGAVSFCEESGVPHGKRHGVASRHVALRREARWLSTRAAPEGTREERGGGGGKGGGGPEGQRNGAGGLAQEQNREGRDTRARKEGGGGG